MVLRMYLFALPAVALFISTLIFPTSAAGRSRRSLAAVVVLCFALLGVFQFTRYGNERLDRFTSGDRAAVQALYRAAPVGTTVVGAANLPWRDRHYADYTYKSINRLPSWGTVPDDPSAVVDDLEALAADADADVHVVITHTQHAGPGGVVPGSSKHAQARRGGLASATRRDRGLREPGRRGLSGAACVRRGEGHVERECVPQPGRLWTRAAATHSLGGLSMGRIRSLLGVVLGAAILAVSGPPAWAASATWTTLTWSTTFPQPYRNSEAQGLVLDGRLYSLGGFDSGKSCCTPTARAYRLDPATGWSSLGAHAGRERDEPRGA